MQKELKYNGYTAQPSDYECQDGDLAAVVNLSSVNGALHPTTNPKSILKLCYSHLQLICKHEGAFGTNYIIYSTSYNKFYWLKSDSDASVWANYKAVHSGLIRSYYSVSCVGNVLMIFTASGIKYYIWDISEYKDLGELPELNLQFGVKNGKHFGYFKHEGLATSGLPKDSQTGYVKISSPYNLSEANQNAVTEALLAQANKAIATIHDAGYFIFPFFVRYAFRLFDGSTTRASAPILVCPSTLAPFIPTTYEGNYFSFSASGYLLYYYLNDASELDTLTKWKDLISSIDIFISAPIYTYDQSGKCERMLPVNYITKSNGFYSIVDGLVTGVTRVNGTAVFELPQFEGLMEKFTSNSAFYLYHSIPISELISQKATVIEAKENYMSGLVSRETLQDDYDSHDTYVAKAGFNYNARMNLYGMMKKKFDGFHPSTCFSRVNPGSRTEVWVESGYWTSDYEEGRGDDTTQYWVDTSHYETINYQDYWLVDCFVHLKTEGSETIVERCNSEYFSFGEYGFPRWFYYPDTKAFKAVFVLQHIPDDQATNGQADVPVYVVELELKAHEFLNGAYYFNGFDAPDYKLVTTYKWRIEDFDIRDVEYSENLPDSCKPLSPVNQKLNFLNKIYTSDVNNPFAFSVININTIGNGEIIGIATAAKALSQGQFGEFPMYAFTTDGIWALTVSTTGAFSAKQPITRDVCVDTNSITQIDSAVLFASERGIMLISGSETQCISEVINNDGEPFLFTKMPLFNEINNLLDFNSYVFNEVGFKFFIKGCQMLYAYNRQQIIVFKPSYKYAYVYSLNSKSWSIIESSIKSKINSYPEALAMLSNGELVDYSQEGEVSDSQFLITRPIKLDGSLKDINKTIDTIITRGNFEKGHVATVLYGSRDLKNWFPVYTSKDHYLRHFRGTPYKYFRIALICSLTHNESIWGSSIQYTPKLTNQPR